MASKTSSSAGSVAAYIVAQMERAKAQSHHLAYNMLAHRLAMVKDDPRELGQVPVSPVPCAFITGWPADLSYDEWPTPDPGACWMEPAEVDAVAQDGPRKLGQIPVSPVPYTFISGSSADLSSDEWTTPDPGACSMEPLEIAQDDPRVLDVSFIPCAFVAGWPADLSDTEWLTLYPSWMEPTEFAHDNPSMLWQVPVSPVPCAFITGWPAGLSYDEWPTPDPGACWMEPAEVDAAAQDISPRPRSPLPQWLHETGSSDSSYPTGAGMQCLMTGLQAVVQWAKSGSFGYADLCRHAS